LASSEGGGSDGGGGWESTIELPLALGKPPTSYSGSTLVASELGGGWSMFAASESGGGAPWVCPHNTSVNMRAKCWFSRGGIQSWAREEDMAPENQLKGKGESRCDGEPEGDSRRDGEPDRFIASAG
jgi:hypothetical protein